MSLSQETTSYVLESPGTPLVRRVSDAPSPGAAEAVVEVLACGLCHTDLGFADGSVSPRHPLPLVLGHEAVGTVTTAGEHVAGWTGRRVLIPAVMPCGACVFCSAGRGNACLDQKMPGNDIDGGFATHLVAPAAALVALDDMPENVDMRELSVVADAVSTAYQAVRRSGLARGDVAFVVGAGGVGGFVIQIARAFGARVVACDVRADRLRTVAAHGAEEVVETGAGNPRELRKRLHGIARGWDVPSLRYRIFECSGTPPGQLLAFSLLARASTLVQVGYTPAKVELRLSNLMAFDATVHGTWGCPLEVYPEVLQLIYAGKVVLSPFVEHAPMSRINTLLDDMAQHRLATRMVLDPRA